ncbi:MAG: AarF/UbiB family protein [Paracoccaceae bacterium]
MGTTEVQQEINTRLVEELDYKNEATHIALYQGICKYTAWVDLPNVYDNFSTNRLLTMSWLDGRSIYNFTDADDEKRYLLAERLVIAWYIPFYNHGVVHGDPHPGNYLVVTDGCLQMVDFGGVRRFPAEFVRGIIHLYHALLHNKPGQAVAAYDMIGVTKMNK